jgi:hypothetical protein
VIGNGGVQLLKGAAEEGMVLQSVIGSGGS